MTDAEIVAWFREGAASSSRGLAQAQSAAEIREFSQGAYRDTRAADAIEENARLRAALVALTTNPHLNLGDLVYTVREREELGWEGPAVKAWSDAVQAADAALRKPDAAGGAHE